MSHDENDRKSREGSHDTDDLKCPRVTTRTRLGLDDASKCVSSDVFKSRPIPLEHQLDQEDRLNVLCVRVNQ